MVSNGPYDDIFSDFHKNLEQVITEHCTDNLHYTCTRFDSALLNTALSLCTHVVHDTVTNLKLK